MRLWSIHPKYLDSKGLVALWREALLARKVLRGKTRGYRHHPQLERFRSHPTPVAAINFYLREIFLEAKRRGFDFDPNKLSRRQVVRKLTVNSEQVEYEMRHLRGKLDRRDANALRLISSVKKPHPHPLFRISKGPIEKWERITSSRDS